MATRPLILFAHGAGAGPDSEFMQVMSENLEANGLAVKRFEFPYWTKIRETGKRRPPDRQPVLLDEMVAQARSLSGSPVWLMGKSMGARIAFQCADKVGAKGAIALGFPFHPPAKPDRSRAAELNNERTHNLVIQGTRDPFGNPQWVSQQALPQNLRMQWIEQGNHDLVPTRATGISKDESWAQVAKYIAKFIREHS